MRYGVGLLIVLSMALLVIGLMLPLMDIEKKVLFKKYHNTYSVVTGVQNLWQDKQYVLAAIIFFWSVVFPIAKLFGLALIWAVRMPAEQIKKLLHWLGILGKWSMLDVFVVAVMIVAVKMKPLLQIEPRAGIYVFCAAIMLSMITTMVMERLARRQLR